MSKTNSLHYELCTEGAKWLKRRKYDYVKCQNKPCNKPELCRHCKAYKYIAVELNVTAVEHPDVWGYDGYSTVVIEVKTSHSDFLADKKKYWRNCEPEYQAGNARWYLCPEGIIKPEELPEGWGLLYWDGKRINPIVGPTERLQGSHGDMRIMYSILFREKFPCKIYDYRGTRSTIQPKTINGIPEKEFYKQKEL